MLVDMPRQTLLETERDVIWRDEVSRILRRSTELHVTQ
jgi:hypothetical protein